ncbi:MAG: GlxA family transcriptional regulator, partial [Novosphingobium sp.]
VVGGGGVNQAAKDEQMLTFFRARADSVRRLCSVCSGAVMLAEAGLLDGRRATTHWRRVPEFTRHYPAVRVEPDSIFVRDGHIWTSAGISAGIDLALVLIGQDLGEGIAREVAREMVVYYRRPGGQSQFSALLAMGCADERFGRLLAWMRGHIGERLTVDVLAQEAAMSPRHFSRAFREATGMSPAKAVERLRLEIARAKVEDTAQPIEAIAFATGFNDPERMRRAFLRAFGTPPQAMRRNAQRG